MKLLITVPWGERLGGAENMLMTFLRGVDKDRIVPTVVFFQAGPFEREVASLGISTVTVPAGRLRNAPRAAWTVARLALIIRAEKPDMVLNWMAKTHLYGATAAALAGRRSRVVWWQHGIPSGGWLDRLATALPARAVGCSSRAGASAQARLRPRRPTFVVLPGVDEPGVDQADSLAARKQLDLPEKAFIVGSVGRLHPARGQHRVLRALAELRRRGLPVHGLFVGDGAYGLAPDYARRLHSLAHDLELSDRVTFTGHTEDVELHLRAMDVLVNASIGESFGISTVEAMIHEIPVVALASGGPQEIIRNGVSGVLVEPEDENALPDAIAALLEDAVLRARIAKAGRNRAHSCFGASRMVNELHDRLEALVQ
jgi:glycosyltransferase involved in cell wall biosynthesis